MTILLLALAGSASRLTPPAPSREAAYNRLLFAGDVMFSRAVRRAILDSGDFALPFRKLAPLLAAADIAFINLETPFSDSGPYHEHGLVFHAAPEMIAGLQLAKIALASTANNHSRDCGSHGVEYTIRWLHEHNVAPVGSSESAGLTHAGVVSWRTPSTSRMEIGVTLMCVSLWQIRRP